MSHPHVTHKAANEMACRSWQVILVCGNISVLYALSTDDIHRNSCVSHSLYMSQVSKFDLLKAEINASPSSSIGPVAVKSVAAVAGVMTSVLLAEEEAEAASKRESTTTAFSNILPAVPSEPKTDLKDTLIHEQIEDLVLTEVHEEPTSSTRDDAQIHNPIFPSRLQSIIAQTRKAQAPLFDSVSSENDPTCMPAMSSIPLYSRHNGGAAAALGEEAAEERIVEGQEEK